MEELLEKFKVLKIGDRIILTMETLLGDSTEVKATYKGNLKQHGFVKPTGGSWALYGGINDKMGFTIPCYQINIKPYRCAKTRFISFSDIKDVKKGW